MKILITDSLFIFPEHEQKLRDEGFEIERLDKPQATEDELVEALKDKDGYILGGIEVLTDKIIDLAPNLKAIVFTGIGYKDFIPNYNYVLSKGISIANTPDGPTHAVAEWAIGATLLMNRGFLELGNIGNKNFLTTKGIESQHIGIVGLGRIGIEIGKMIAPFKPASISYYSRDDNKDTDFTFKPLGMLLSESDIIFLCVSKDAGKHFFGEKEIASMKDEALLVSFMAKDIVDEEALLKELQKGRIRSVSDHPLSSEASKELPSTVWYCFNASNAFNTEESLKRVSDMATDSMINLLKTGEDKNKV